MNELFEIKDLRYIISLFQKERQAVLPFIEGVSTDDRKQFAADFCSQVMDSLAAQLFHHKKKYGDYLSPAPYGNSSLLNGLHGVARRMGELLSAIPLVHAGFMVGTLYTSLLPVEFRNLYGVFYTPPALVHRLLKKIDNTGFDWHTSRIIDPACGGSAFLSPVAFHIKNSYFRAKAGDDEGLLNIITSNLAGSEIDSYAAWLSQRMLEMALIDVNMRVEFKLPNLIRVGDSLSMLESLYNQYDLVIGNPPFGKLRLSEKLREKYSESLYGHANYYGLFTHLATNLNNSKGMIAFVMPTSFLGGQYFKELRSLISRKYNLHSIDFITSRNGVFEKVLQEIALVVLRKSQGERRSSIFISNLTPIDDEYNYQIDAVGNYQIILAGHQPWLLPRNKFQKKLLINSRRNFYTLSDYGFRVLTGQLVWNRHKEQIKSEEGEMCLPLIWAESVLPDGSFQFRATQKNHRPFFELRTGQEFLVTSKSCVIVQRTTAREQNRRILAAVVPEEFFRKYTNGAVIENHLNIIIPDGNAAVPLEVIARLLNSSIIDELFRCINGSVAVSAYELYSIPLPDPAFLENMKQMIADNISQQEIDHFIEKLYGVDNGRTTMQVTGIKDHSRQITLDFSARDKKPPVFNK